MIKKKWDMFAESVSMSLSNIAGNKMRTFLTTLGIIIGVGAIIALMTVVQGATDTMNAQFDAMGLGTLRVSVAGTAIKHGLTDDDLQTILDCEHVAGISPSLNATVTAKRGNVWSDSISVNGNNDEYFRHNPDLLRRGRAIDVLDVENNARVCLVDGDAAKTLFFGEDPVGQTFYLDGFEYTVVGMIDEDENASLFSQILMGGKTDGTVYVPYSSAKKLLGTSTVTAVEVKKVDGTAKFTGEKQLEVTKPDGSKESMTADAIIVATGSVNAQPPIPGLKENPNCIDSTGALSLDKLPATMVVIGGGVIGLELACAYAAFGTKITVVEAMDHMLPMLDGDLTKIGVAHMKKMGMEFHLENYSEHSLDEGSTSRAASYVGLTWGDGTVTWGAGTDTDIIVAGIKALVSAINNK